jgi:hypothetical protein
VREVLRTDLRSLLELGEVELLAQSRLAEAGADVEHARGMIDACRETSVAGTDVLEEAVHAERYRAPTRPAYPEDSEHRPAVPATAAVAPTVSATSGAAAPGERDAAIPSAIAIGIAKPACRRSYDPLNRVT